MKSYLSILFLAAVALAAEAKLQPVSILSLQNKHLSTRMKSESQSQYIPTLILLDADASSKSELENLGVIFYRERGNIHLTAVPRSALSDVLQVEGIIDISCANTSSLCLDKAREFSFVDAVQNATTGFSDLPFTGKGVVTGISDIGFDPHHIAFEQCLRSVADFHPENNELTVLSTSELEDWSTDNDSKTHATHVGNILAGSYLDNEYYGVAPGSDFVATTSALYDVGILLGVEHIVDYAAEKGERAVVNLSLSSSIGPRDGTSLRSQYLNLVAEQTDAVICISSGNYGWTLGHAYYIFTDENQQASLMVKSGKNLKFSNYVDLWSSDSLPFGVRCEVVDVDTDESVFSTVFYGTDTDETVVASPSQFDGTITIQGYLCPMNNRYNITAALDYTTSVTATDSSSARYVCMLTVEAEPNTRIDAWADLNPMTLTTCPDSRTSFNVTTDGTVNDMVTGNSVIAVGSCTSRNTVPVYPDGSYSYSYDLGNVSEWSSYASETSQCRALPDICAPGQNLISAMSSPYAATKSNPRHNAQIDIDDNSYFWFADQGTSMASPFAAGVIALWLEANPDLSVQDIKDIARSTALTDFSDYPSTQWGPGCIDAAAGLEKALSLANIRDVNADSGTDVITAIYTLGGIRLPHTSLSNLSPGTYIIVTSSGAYKISK